MGAGGVPQSDEFRNAALNLVGIVAALAAEARALGPTKPGFEPLRSLADGTMLAVSGMGCAAAARAAQSLVEAGVTALASWGMAGGLDPALRAGTIVLPDQVISADGASFPTTRYWRERLAAALAARQVIANGKLLSSAHAIEAVADKAAAFGATGALAVDMESLAIAQIAAAQGLPFIAVRVIVDTAHDALPRAAVAASRSGQFQIWRLIGALALAPAEISAVIRLAQRYRTARRSLVAVAHAGSLAQFALPALADASVS
jgi:hopanoid-associated phosphorylase